MKKSGYATEARTAELQTNKLRVLSPDVFARLPNLETLRLDHNQLQSLSSNIFENLTNLKYLPSTSGSKEKRKAQHKLPVLHKKRKSNKDQPVVSPLEFIKKEVNAAFLGENP
ncbi:uncharacterized protein [Apostichopus japonicus]|uniref:uncharacterized protein isoform X2 n=1 Tax=Stichopus japonicus TaxID=307972 RepID=UPI003AB4A908